jgi:hypothetical protein
VTAKVIQVIETTEKRGSGKDESSPIRGVTQYWSLDGELLAENDPYAGGLKFSTETMAGDPALYENPRGERLEFLANFAPIDIVDYRVSGPWRKVAVQ